MLTIAGWKRALIWAVVIFGLAYAAPNLFYGRVEGHNDAVTAIERQGSTPEREAAKAAWPEILPSNLVNLGLDLRGGAHLLAEVQTKDVYAERMQGYWPGIRDALVAERGTVGAVSRENAPAGQLRIRIGQPEGMAKALEIVRGLSQPVASLTAAGARDIEAAGQGDILTVSFSEAEMAATDDRTMAQSLEIIRRRVDEAGTREPTIQRQGDDRILIEVPGFGSSAELKELIGETAKLTFHPVIRQTADLNEAAGLGNVVMADAKGAGGFVLEVATPVTGDDLADAQPSFDQNGRAAVSFKLNPSGGRKFCEYTSANIGAPFAIVLDNKVISAPTIQSAICGGSGIITGNFTVESSTALAVQLRSGALPAKMVFLEEQTIGPGIGQDSISAGLRASLVGAAAVLIFMAASYGLFGVFANLALMINVGLLFGILSMIGATLTLPGIAGIVLTIGMAVDANVLIFERIREELKTARGPARAIELGYNRALSAIIDANITTFMTAVILLIMGSGPVRGFAWTLMIGIVTSVFTAVFVTRLMVVMWFERARPKTIEV